MKKLLLVLLTVLLAFCCTSVVSFAEDANKDASVGGVEDINKKLNGIFDIEGLSVTSVSVVADAESYMVINGVITEDGKDTPWSGKYALTEEQYLALFHANESVLVYEKSSGKDMLPETAKVISDAIDASVTDLSVDIDFKPAEFTRNLKYMGLGMLGIFVVVGVVIVLTFVLNKSTTKKEA